MHAGHRVGVVVVDAEAGVLLALLTEEFSQRQLATHGGGGRGFGGFGRLGSGLKGFATRSCLVGNIHHLCGSLDTAVGGGGRRRVGEDPDAVDLLALDDDIRV